MASNRPLERIALILVAAGLVIGLPIALASTSVIASQLFAIRTTDPLTFAAVAGLLVLAALAACTCATVPRRSIRWSL